MTSVDEDLIPKLPFYEEKSLINYESNITSCDNVESVASDEHVKSCFKHDNNIVYNDVEIHGYDDKISDIPCKVPSLKESARKVIQTNISLIMDIGHCPYYLVHDLLECFPKAERILSIEKTNPYLVENRCTEPIWKTLCENDFRQLNLKPSHGKSSSEVTSTRHEICSPVQPSRNPTYSSNTKMLPRSGDMIELDDDGKVIREYHYDKDDLDLENGSDSRSWTWRKEYQMLQNLRSTKVAESCEKMRLSYDAYNAEKKSKSAILTKKMPPIRNNGAGGSNAQVSGSQAATAANRSGNKIFQFLKQRQSSRTRRAQPFMQSNKSLQMRFPQSTYVDPVFGQKIPLGTQKLKEDLKKSSYEGPISDGIIPRGFAVPNSKLSPSVFAPVKHDNKAMASSALPTSTSFTCPTTAISRGSSFAKINQTQQQFKPSAKPIREQYKNGSTHTIGKRLNEPLNKRTPAPIVPVLKVRRTEPYPSSITSTYAQRPQRSTLNIHSRISKPPDHSQKPS